MEWEEGSEENIEARRRLVHLSDPVFSFPYQTDANMSTRSDPIHYGKPHLEIIIEPQSKFRFRYKSEMTGKHGSLLGVTPRHASSSGGGTSGGIGEIAELAASDSFFTSAPSWSPSSNAGNTTPTSASTAATSSSGIQSKLFPTVKLHNFSGNAVIRVSLVCDTRPHYPHPHLLEMGQSSSPLSELDTYSVPTIGESLANDYIELPVSDGNDHTAIFQGLNIIYVSKKETRRILQKKMTLVEDPRRKVTLEQMDDLALTINLNTVALYFEAFVRDPQNHGNLIQICPPVVSSPIHHNKSTQTGELRIVRIDKFSSCCTGNEEVFILVEKVDKHNIQVKFYEESDKGLEIWKSYGKFSKIDVHHQYAIVFKTPPYRNLEIDTEVSVWIQLERISDGTTSRPIPFRYRPIEQIRKMPKRQPRSRNEETEQRQFDPSMDRSNSGAGASGGGNTGNYGDDNGGGNPLAGPSNIRQGASFADVSFPCGDPSQMASSSSNDASKSKSLAMSVALSITQGLHGWAETSDFGLVLQKLRHLLCLVNEHGDNALHSAIVHQQKEPFLRILETLSSFPDTISALNEPNLQSLTPLHLAVLTNRVDFVSELLHHNVDISFQNSEGDTPLHTAVKAGDISIIKMLLQSPTAPAALNKFNYSSMSPLLLALSSGSTELVEILTNHKGTSLHAQEGTFGRSALHMAVEKETKESIISTMIILRAAGKDAADLTNIQNYAGSTPLHIAANLGYTTLCALLMHYGADPHIENHVRKETDEDDENKDTGCEDDEEKLSGQTVFDVINDDQVLRVLKGTLDDWEIILKACSPLLLPSSSPMMMQMDKDFESKPLDSGIDVNTFNSSQFLNSSSSNQL